MRSLSLHYRASFFRGGCCFFEKEGLCQQSGFAIANWFFFYFHNQLPSSVCNTNLFTVDGCLSIAYAVLIVEVSSIPCIGNISYLRIVFHSSLFVNSSNNPYATFSSIRFRKKAFSRIFRSPDFRIFYKLNVDISF